MITNFENIWHVLCLKLPLMAAFAKPLLCAGRFISTKFNLKTK